jgi:hypothetical protein
MLNKLKKAVLILCIGSMPFTIFGQNNTISPYSMYGIGDLFVGGGGRSSSMGGVATPLFSIFNLNPSNPASYFSIPQNTFIFEVSMGTNWYTLKNATNSFSKVDANVRSIAIGFPLTKWWKSGLGLNPFSSVGYDIQQNANYPLYKDTSKTTIRYTGSGGINSFYFDNSFQIFKSLSIGVKINYLFGSLDRLRWEDSYSYRWDSDTLYNYQMSSNYYESNKYILHAFSFDVGGHFHKKVTTNLFLNLGVNYSFNTNLNTQDESFSTSTISKIIKNRGDTTIFTTGIKDTLNNSTINGKKMQIPKSIAFGASAILFQKLELAFDYKKDYWSESNFFGESQNFNNNQRYSFGLEFIPDNNSTSYLKLIRYRAGYNYTKSYLSIENHQLKQVGASLGFGFPIRSGAIIDVGLLYSHRGATGLDILTENYFQLNLSFSFVSNWFVKRHFD